MKCCICKQEIQGWGNNPWPLCRREDEEARCCDLCNMLVIQARLTKGEKLHELRANLGLPRDAELI